MLYILCLAVLFFSKQSFLLTKSVSLCSGVYLILMAALELLLLFAIYLAASISATLSDVSCFMPVVICSDNGKSRIQRLKTVPSDSLKWRAGLSATNWADELHSKQISTAVILTGANGVLGQSFLK